MHATSTCTPTPPTPTVNTPRTLYRSLPPMPLVTHALVDVRMYARVGNSHPCFVHIPKSYNCVYVQSSARRVFYKFIRGYELETHALLINSIFSLTCMSIYIYIYIYR